MIKLGMIGMGGMGTGHARVISKIDGVEIVGVCDLIEHKARTIGEEVGAKWCTDHRELLDEVDAVWICTEPFNRVDVVTAAAEAGKHIFTEKPVSNNLKDADTMIAAAQKAGVIYMLGYCLRFWQPFKLMHDALKSGELGDLVSCWTRRMMPADMSPLWYGDQEKSGGITLDFGSHDVNWLQWLGGDVKTVFASTARVRETLTADEHAQLTMTFADGGSAMVEVSWWCPLGESSLGIVGTKGAILVDRAGTVRKKIEGAEEEVVEVRSTVDIDIGGGLDAQDERVTERDETIQEHFFRCVRDGLAPVTPAADGRKTLAVVKAALASAERGTSVDLTEFA